MKSTRHRVKEDIYNTCKQQKYSYLGYVKKFPQSSEKKKDNSKQKTGKET